jgi:DNA repair protein RadA/Sms
MAKDKTVFFCKECGQESVRWQGRCSGCGAWNSLVEAPSEKTGKTKQAKAGNVGAIGTTIPQPLAAVPLSERSRLDSGSQELNRVLGGGFLPGSFLLLSGDPGIGKSTLVLQAAAHLAKTMKVLYVSGEESAPQLRMRAERLGLVNAPLDIYTETSFSHIRDEIRSGAYRVVFVDSIQTMYTDTAESSPGSVSQVRESAAAFLRLAKEEDVLVFLVGHVTKDGAVAGPRILEHMVDAVLTFEGDSHHIYRLLRAVKNRFGPTGEIGVFEMCGDGLREVENPSALFMGSGEEASPGAAVAVLMEGTRPMLTEVQALITSGAYPPPRRTVNGMDHHRLLMLLAVLDRRGEYSFQNKEVFVNVAGGLTIEEPAADLAVAAALLSGYRDTAVGPTAFIGEIGLTGEVRGVSHLGARVREAAKFGFTSCVVPETGLSAVEETDCRLFGVRHIRELFALLK